MYHFSIPLSLVELEDERKPKRVGVSVKQTVAVQKAKTVECTMDSGEQYFRNKNMEYSHFCWLLGQNTSRIGWNKL